MTFVIWGSVICALMLAAGIIIGISYRKKRISKGQANLSLIVTAAAAAAAAAVMIVTAR